jgi:hypothetical protein
MTRSLILALIAMLASVSLASAQNFRVETDLLIGDETKPFAETLTLFHDGLVYDLIRKDEGEITIFDPRMGNFTMLHPKHQTKTVITTQEILESCLSLNLHASESKDPFFAFAADPKFAVSEERLAPESSGKVRVTLAHQVMTYSAIGMKPQLAEATTAYRSFADWVNRLNALRPGGMLPEPRMRLNEELFNRGLVPDEVVRIIHPTSRFQKEVKVRSRHLYNWTLSKTDRDRLDEIGGHRVNFKNVPLKQYWALDQSPIAAKK